LDVRSAVQAAYRHAGNSIPRTTYEHVYAGNPVDVTAVYPGDLVFIPGGNGTREQPGHVGMYLGNGLIIHAPRTGDVIKLVELSRWRTKIAAVRRC
jgi:cell wall-associated NlpC family hydrolase